MMDNALLRLEYDKVKKACRVDWKSVDAGNAIFEMASVSLNFLANQCHTVNLVSKVPRKDYFTYTKDGIVARPANKQFFISESLKLKALWEAWQSNHIQPKDFAKLSYTIALAPCLAMELFDRQNKKGPATYFECYIGHLFAKAAGTNPTKRIRIPVTGKNVPMTMDFLFDLGEKHRKIHLPVKMSTRERVVQAWAHQRLLDAAYGIGTYRGILVLFSETKLDSRSHEVVEICVPDQWLVYQSLLAHMDRVYYFDIPSRYKTLTAHYPRVITIKQFGEFFREKKSVLYS